MLVSSMLVLRMLALMRWASVLKASSSLVLTMLVLMRWASALKASTTLVETSEQENV